MSEVAEQTITKMRAITLFSISHTEHVINKNGIRSLTLAVRNNN